MNAPASRLRLIFLGSGEFGLPTLKRLYADHHVLAVVSQPDKPAGRHRYLTPTPIAHWAAEQGITVIKADDVNAPDIVHQIADLQPDAAVVIAFGQKVAPPTIAALGRLVVNLHGSLLPKYRGAAPINWAIIQGEAESGVTVIGLAQRMDAGCVYAKVATPIGDTETAGELHDRLALLGPDAVADVLHRFQQGTLTPDEQDHTQATRAPKLSRADSIIQFDADPRTVCRRIHGLTPWPGAKTAWRDEAGVEHALTLVRADPAPDHLHHETPGTLLDGGLIAVHGGAIRLLDVQPPGKRVMTFRQYANGHPLHPGARFTAPQP